MAFRLGNQRIDGKNIRFYLSTAAGFNNMFDFVHAAVMMRMFLIVGMFTVFVKVSRSCE